MKLLICDVETTGLDPKTDKVTEIAWVEYETDNKRILSAQSYIIRQEGKLPEVIKEITGLSDDNMRWGISATEAGAAFMRAVCNCQYLVGHNIDEFDAHFINKFLHDSGTGDISDIKTIDTRTCLPLTYQPKSRSLASLCLDHEFLNYFPHSALGDSLVTMKLLSKYDINAVIARAAQPTLTIQAVVSYADKDKAKARGFHWMPEKKIWKITMKESDYNPKDYDFKTKIIKE
jgi:DNA polymerase III alpha subunit (gram-positive type)